MFSAGRGICYGGRPEEDDVAIVRVDDKNREGHKLEGIWTLRVP